MRLLSILAVGTTAIVSSSCGGGLAGVGGGGGGSAGGAAGISSQCKGDFGQTKAAMELESFLLATDGFLGAAADIESSLLQTCRAMASELGMSEAELSSAANEPEVQAVCNAVGDRIRSEMQDLRANANLQVVVAARPPKCEVSVDAYAGCMAECDASFDPGQVDLKCEGGELRGGCSGKCEGSCSAEVNGQCSGSCEGTCSAGCSGRCEGVCEGKCAAKGPDGECRGRCDGTCKGSCSAGCQGSCSGQCVVKAKAQCTGECRGSCSVEWTEPKCTGTVRPPSASAECEASCDARLDAKAECEPGEMHVDIQGSVDQNVSEKVARVRQAIESGMSNVLLLRAKLDRLGASGAEMVQAGGRIPDAVGTLGLNAARCATQAVAALPRATASVSVSVQVSASLSASAGT